MTNVRLARRRAPVFTPRRVAPAQNTEELRDTIRRFFEAPFEQPLMTSFRDLVSQAVGLRPPMQVVETPEEFTVTAELPGMDRKDVSVEYEDGILIIRGQKEETLEDKEPDRRYLMWERSYGSFERAFTVDGVDADNIRAAYNEGVLTVHLPKTPATKTKGRKIQIDQA